MDDNLINTNKLYIPVPDTRIKWKYKLRNDNYGDENHNFLSGHQTWLKVDVFVILSNQDKARIMTL